VNGLLGVDMAAGRGFGPRLKKFSVPTPSADQLKIFTLSRKDCQLPSDLGLV
jgi:hypothetical protein